jgi:hypothetical protein
MYEWNSFSGKPSFLSLRMKSEPLQNFPWILKVTKTPVQLCHTITWIADSIMPVVIVVVLVCKRFILPTKYDQCYLTSQPNSPWPYFCPVTNKLAQNRIFPFSCETVTLRHKAGWPASKSTTSWLHYSTHTVNWACICIPHSYTAPAMDEMGI